MESFESVVKAILEYWPVFGVAVIEIILRIWPSDRIRSIFSIVGKVLLGLGEIFFKISDSLSHYVPDNTSPEE